MPVKIRLKRLGKRGIPYYHIVVADSRRSRDGRFIEQIGSYDPNSNPATIVLDNDKALQWLKNGAQPTDTTRAILSYKGVMYKQHLQKGVAKGVLTQEQADEKYNAWLEEKNRKVSGKRIRVINEKKKAVASALETESKKKEERAEAIRKKNTPPPAEAAPAAETPAAEVPATETPEAPPAAE